MDEIRLQRLEQRMRENEHMFNRIFQWYLTHPLMTGLFHTYPNLWREVQWPYPVARRSEIEEMMNREAGILNNEHIKPPTEPTTPDPSDTVEERRDSSGKTTTEEADTNKEVNVLNDEEHHINSPAVGDVAIVIHHPESNGLVDTESMTKTTEGGSNDNSELQNPTENEDQINFEDPQANPENNKQQDSELLPEKGNEFITKGESANRNGSTGVTTVSITLKRLEKADFPGPHSSSKMQQTTDDDVARTSNATKKRRRQNTGNSRKRKPKDQFKVPSSKQRTIATQSIAPPAPRKSQRTRTIQPIDVSKVKCTWACRLKTSKRKELMVSDKTNIQSCNPLANPPPLPDEEINPSSIINSDNSVKKSRKKPGRRLKDYPLAPPFSKGIRKGQPRNRKESIKYWKNHKQRDGKKQTKMIKTLSDVKPPSTQRSKSPDIVINSKNFKRIAHELAKFANKQRLDSQSSDSGASSKSDDNQNNGESQDFGSERSPAES